MSAASPASPGKASHCGGKKSLFTTEERSEAAQPSALHSPSLAAVPLQVRRVPDLSRGTSGHPGPNWGFRKGRLKRCREHRWAWEHVRPARGAWEAMAMRSSGRRTSGKSQGIMSSRPSKAACWPCDRHSHFPSLGTGICMRSYSPSSAVRNMGPWCKQAGRAICVTRVFPAFFQ